MVRTAPVAEDPASHVRRLWARQGVEKPNVILITLDTTRADHLGCYGYADARTPSLDALARGGVLFAQAATAAPLTQPAHSSIMTGLLPHLPRRALNGTAALSQAQTTLAEALSREGYQTGAFIGAFVLDGRWGLNQGFEHLRRPVRHEEVQAPGPGGGPEAGRPGDGRRARAGWRGTSSEPFFAWVHLYDAHSPYEPPEPLLSEFRGRGRPASTTARSRSRTSRWAAACRGCRSAGLDRKTILVVVGDHGEGLGSHGEGTHGYFIYDYVAARPVHHRDAVRRAAAACGSTAQVSLVDVFPTVLALAGIECHGARSTAGRSFR